MSGEWRPIATAPKDGSWIVVTSTHNRYYRAAVQWVDGCWLDCDDCEETNHNDMMQKAATHWMLLPEPPES